MPDLSFTYDLSDMASEASNASSIASDASSAAASHAALSNPHIDWTNASSNFVTTGTMNVASNLLSVGEVASKIGVETNAPDSLFTLATDGIIWLGATGRAVDSEHTTADGTVAVCISQGANDDYVLIAKSNDVAHGVTNQFETDTYFAVGKVSATAGGAKFGGITEGTIGFQMVSMAGTEDTTKATTSTAGVLLIPLKTSGVSIAANSANSNLVAIRGWTGSAYNTRWIADYDGDTWQPGTATCNHLIITDGITAPSAVSGEAKIYVDTADGDLKVIFGDGTVKTIVVDT